MAVLPSSTGGGITRAAEFIFQALENKRQRALQERQVSNAERITDLNAFNSLLPFLDEGSTLGSLPPSAQRLFGTGTNVDPGEHQDLILNRQTFAEAIDSFSLSQFENLSPEERGRLEVVRSAQGLEPLSEIADLRRLSASMSQEGLDRIRQDPQRFDDFIARQEGLDPITIRFPDGESQSFDRVEAAQIYAVARRDRAVNDTRLDGLDLERRDRLVEMVQAQVRRREFEIGEPAVLRVFDIFDLGDAAIDSFLNDPRTTEGEKLAMNSLRGSISFGEEHEFENVPVQLRSFLTISRLVEEIQGADPEIVQDLIDQLPEKIFGTMTEGFLGLGTPRLQIGGGEDPETPAIDIGDDVEFSPEQQSQIISGVLEAGGSRESLVARFGEEAVASAGGPSDPVAPATPGEETRQRTIADIQANIDSTTARISTANPATRAVAENRLADLQRQLAVEQTNVPIEIEASGNIPAGGINPANVPASVRAKVAQVNSLIRAKANTQSVRAISNLDERIRKLIREIRLGIAEG